MSGVEASPDDVVRSEVARVAASGRLLVALDFDGTLAPLVDEPMSARMLPAARAALDELAGLSDTTVALVSGRTLVHLGEISEHTPDSLIHLAGSHGAEFWHPGEDPGAAIDDDVELRDELSTRAEAAVAEIDGAWIERKQFGFGLHTRRASSEAAAAAITAVDAIVAVGAPAWRRRTGQDILEFASRHEGKDSAIIALKELVRADAVVFAGDDVTDEDALAVLGADDLGIRVGAGETSATIRVPDAAALATLLGTLAGLRAAR